MTRRRCLDCPALIPLGTSRCPACQRTHEQRRGTRQARGYGAAHEQRRKRDKVQVDAGAAHCWRCGAWLNPIQPWHEGHDDHDRTVYRGPECVPCNTATATRR